MLGEVEVDGEGGGGRGTWMVWGLVQRHHQQEGLLDWVLGGRMRETSLRLSRGGSHFCREVARGGGGSLGQACKAVGSGDWVHF